jgi:hypothetical protein
MEAISVEVNAEFSLSELRKLKDDETELRRLVRKELIRLAEICYLEDVFALPLLEEILDVVKEECVKFKTGPRTTYPDPRYNILKIQINMPTRGKVGVVHWGTKVIV